MKLSIAMVTPSLVPPPKLLFSFRTFVCFFVLLYYASFFFFCRVLPFLCALLTSGVSYFFRRVIDAEIKAKERAQERIAQKYAHSHMKKYCIYDI